MFQDIFRSYMIIKINYQQIRINLFINNVSKEIRIGQSTSNNSKQVSWPNYQFSCQYFSLILISWPKHRFYQPSRFLCCPVCLLDKFSSHNRTLILAHSLLDLIFDSGSSLNLGQFSIQSHCWLLGPTIGQLSQTSLLASLLGLIFCYYQILHSNWFQLLLESLYFDCF